MRAVVAVLEREWRLALRRRSEWAQSPVFYAIVATLFALGAAPDAPWLKVAAPSILWVGALLAAMLSLERVFRSDYDDGTLEQLFLSPQPVSVLVAAKMFAQWTLIGLPLTLLGPVIGFGLGMSGTAQLALLGSLLLGLPALVLLAGFAAALTVGLPRVGILLPVLVLPLSCPVVIFGAGAVRAAQDGLSPEAPLYFLGAILVLCASGIPSVTAAALRNSLE